MLHKGILFSRNAVELALLPYCVRFFGRRFMATKNTNSTSILNISLYNDLPRMQIEYASFFQVAVHTQDKLFITLSTTTSEPSLKEIMWQIESLYEFGKLLNPTLDVNIQLPGFHGVGLPLHTKVPPRVISSNNSSSTSSIGRSSKNNHDRNSSNNIAGDTTINHDSSIVNISNGDCFKAGSFLNDLSENTNTNINASIDDNRVVTHGTSSFPANCNTSSINERVDIFSFLKNRMVGIYTI